LPVAVETYPEIPADKKAQYAPEKRAEFFRNWALERASARRVGIYILICMKPGWMEVGMDKAARRRAFRDENRKQVVSEMRAKFKQKEFDAALLTGLDHIRAAV